MSQNYSCLLIMNFFYLSFYFGLLARIAYSETHPSTSMQIPPLQWINLTNLLTGPGPPPLRDSSIGYDEVTRSLLIFGGLSDGQVVTGKTFILNLDNLSWSEPQPSVDLAPLEQTPPPRSQAVGGADFAANSRRDFVIFGGMGLSGGPMNDIWSYNYENRFWLNTTASNQGPSARWNSAGGTDLLFSIQNPNPLTLNTTMYVLGGTNGKTTEPLSDVWELTLDGTLSSNVQDVRANWNQVAWPSSQPPKVGQSSAVLPGGIVIAYGGCNATTGSQFNASCAGQDAYVFNTVSETTILPPGCPAPRFAASLVPNYNTFSTSFATQLFLLLGSFDSAKWNDSHGLQNGEVAVLDTSTSSWARILPSGDPGNPSGTPTFPSPREGVAALSYPSALVGANRQGASDTIIFGGQDAGSGNLLEEVWLLRAYDGVITGTNQKWSGFGNGNLGTGINASGTGVTVTYIEQCALAISMSSQPNGSSPLPSSTPIPPPSPEPSSSPLASLVSNASISHKVLSPVAIAMFLASVLIFRPFTVDGLTRHSTTNLRLLYGAALLAIISLASGTAGIIIAFNSASVVTIQKRAKENFLRSSHGKAGLVLFIALYGPFLIYLIWQFSHRSSVRSSSNTDEKLAHGTDELLSTSGSSPRPSSAAPTPAETGHPSAPPNGGIRQRTRSAGASFGNTIVWPLLQRRGTRVSRLSTDSVDLASTESAPVTQGFEVINRPKNLRPHATSSGQIQSLPGYHALPRSLSDISWLERRRSLNAVGELDYMLSQASTGPITPHKQQPQIQDRSSSLPLVTPRISTTTAVRSRSPLASLCRLAFQAILFANVVFALIALWSLGGIPPFIIFLIWALLAYSGIVLLAWHGVPRSSSLVAILSAFREQSVPTTLEKPTDAPESIIADQPFTTPDSSPYLHQPTVRQASPHFDYPPHSPYFHPPRTAESDPEDDEEDEDKQQRMEREMQRRDVSIITVPRRQLRIANI